MSFFLEKLFCNFIRTQIYKCLSNPQHESCDLGPNTSKVPKFSIYTVYTYTVSAANCTCKKERRRKERMRNWNVTTWGKITEKSCGIENACWNNQLELFGIKAELIASMTHSLFCSHPIRIRSKNSYMLSVRCQ